MKQIAAYKSMLMIRGEEYDASVEICRIKDNLARHKNDLHDMLLESVDYMGNTNRYVCQIWIYL